MDIKEFEVPVPWGHVAVKAWGNEANTPVLAFHGIADNAGSFDQLLPFLPSSFYYICVDLPSQGKSSPYPPHLFISALDNLLTMKLLVNYFDRKKYIFMGHSWGGQTAVLFAQVYPELVLKLIVFDVFYLEPVDVTNFKGYLTDKIDTLMRVNENIAKNKRPSYTYEEAVTKLVDGRLWGELFREAAEVLVERSAIPTQNKRFHFSTDPRLNAYVNPLFDLEFVIKCVKKHPITCPILFIYALDSEAHHKLFNQFIRELKKRNRFCFIKKVAGSHHIHSNSPETIGPIVSSFLLNLKSKM